MTLPIRNPLSFDAVDDLVSAFRKGRLSAPFPGQEFDVIEIGPLLELIHLADYASTSPWLASGTLDPLKSAILERHRVWFNASRTMGILRTLFDTASEEDFLTRTEFLKAASRAAREGGFPAVALSFAAALRELESNVYEHSGSAETGMLVFRATSLGFEFVVADSGVGVLATLVQAPEFRLLTDHGEALSLSLEEGVSRYGRTTDHGMGFHDLFRGMQNLNADLRFRSGDHALTITGERSDLKQSQLAQKPYYQGFLVSVRCRSGREAYEKESVREK